MKSLCLLFCVFLVISCAHKKEKIGIQPYGKINNEWITDAKQALEEIYDCQIVVLPSVDLPKSAFIQIKTPRYRADSLLKNLVKNKPDSLDVVLGLTIQDISTTKRDRNGKIKKPESKYTDWGIFGLGYCPGNACVVSSFRLIKDEKKFVSRWQKVCVHEVGHTMGLPHCPNTDCVMQDAAETIKTVDNVAMKLCLDCKDKLGLE